MERWEHGSSFHLALEVGESQPPWNDRPHSLWGTGRDALRALVRLGRDVHGWRRLLIPSYYCPDVPVCLEGEIEIRLYPRAPTDRVASHVEATAGDVVLAAALFGAAPSVRADRGIPVIEDHSHDPASPLATASRAGYAFASLRKTLPLPDGGVLWSPLDLAIPAEVPTTAAHDEAVLMRLSAMTLKLHYLAGGSIAKEVYRELFARSERAMSSGQVSGISAFSRSRLRSLPIGNWRQARARNLSAFRKALGENPAFTLLGVPFAAVLVLESPSARDRLREILVAADIYAAVLWPFEEPVLPGVPAAHLELARRMLTIHCDHRYTPADMARVAMAVKSAISR